MGNESSASDSHWSTGGQIPGSAGVHAFTLSGPEPSAIPVLIAVPHAGRAYPGSLLERMRNPGFAALRLEDRYVDLLAESVAAATGATLLIANAPRAMLDLNRAADDIDWDMFGCSAPPDVGSYTPGRRARSGLGLIPRRLPGIGELWKRRHDEQDLSARIAGIHQPYHSSLAEALAALRDRWGAALLLDLHSMPPLALRGHQAPPEFVLGDRFGASCQGGLVGSAFSYFAEMRRGAAHNRPYAGGYVLERHAAPGEGLHALQLEIDRSSYLDSRLTEPGKGFAAMTHLLIGLVRRLAGEVSALGRLQEPPGWAEAAE
ncbi:N-formylglutamate amidohydrolase [Novosphingobium sp. PS1R-30]|uniref:N-formylglutamate amidohydrolase n=1 Tax=Novosphingobium anseongense TaxID=3133436 RepID=A0ABU8RZ80_9SPHN